MKFTSHRLNTKATGCYDQLKPNLLEVELQFVLLLVEQIAQNVYT